MEDIGKKREYRRHPELSNLDDEEKKREYAKMYYASHPEIREKAKQRARLPEEKEKRKKYWAKYTGDSEKTRNALEGGIIRRRVGPMCECTMKGIGRSSMMRNPFMGV